MAVTSWIRRQFKNGVIITATTTMTAGATSFTVNTGAGSTFPDGSVGPFIVTVDQLQAAEEKILCSSRTSDTFTVAASGRGYNGTTAQAHTNAVVLHTIDQQDLDEANQVANQTLGAVAAAGDLLVGSAANTLAKLAKGATNTFLQAGASTLQWTAFGVGQSTGVAAAAADGTQTTPAHSDHVHSGLGLPLGLTGATAATRYVGATASGAPGSGTFAQGDFVIDQTGYIWVCTTAGTPGTWNSLRPPAPADATVATTETTTSATYTDLTTVGPAVTLVTGTSVIVTVSALIGNLVGNNNLNAMGYAISGATTLAATDTTALMTQQNANTHGTLRKRITGLTAGSNTFTAKYKANGSATSQFSNRYILVEPL